MSSRKGAFILWMSCEVKLTHWLASWFSNNKTASQPSPIFQIMAYFVSDAISIPGIPGLFIAAVYAASLR